MSTIIPTLFYCNIDNLRNIETYLKSKEFIKLKYINVLKEDNKTIVYFTLQNTDNTNYESRSTFESIMYKIDKLCNN